MDEKRLLKSQEVVKCNVPLYSELSVKELYAEAIQDEELRVFLPEMKVHTCKVPERDFFFGVLGTLKGEYLNALIQEAHSKRFRGDKGERKKDMIFIKDAWLEELTKMPFFSRKMSHNWQRKGGKPSICSRRGRS